MSHDICIGFIRCSLILLMYTILLLSAPIYILQMITIYRHRRAQFATAFFTFLALNSICDGVGVFYLNICMNVQIRWMSLLSYILSMWSPWTEWFGVQTGLLPGMSGYKCL